MDALSYLHRDHQSVLAMLDTLEAPPAAGAGVDDRRNLAQKLVIAESQHESIEEQLFWPAVRDALEDGDDLADQATHQEDEGKQLLQTIESAEAGTAEFEKALSEFISAAREHITFEETRVWPKLREAISPDDTLRLGEQLEAAKESAPTRPHPHTSSSGAAQKSVGKVAAVTDRLRDAATGRGRGGDE